MNRYMMFIFTYLDLPRGAEWMLRGAYTLSFRVQTAPFGRCWYIFFNQPFAVFKEDFLCLQSSQDPEKNKKSTLDTFPLL